MKRNNKMKLPDLIDLGYVMQDIGWTVTPENPESVPLWYVWTSPMTGKKYKHESDIVPPNSAIDEELSDE